MAPTLRPAQRKKAKMRVAVLGPSGSGKTYSALLLARGLASDWSKVALIDSENGSGDLYEHLGAYNVLTLAKFSPRDYVEAIEACESAGMEAVVVDSASHEWEWCKAEVDRIKATSKNEYTAWGPVGKLHDEFLRKLNTSSVHMIEAARTKQDYVLVERNGKKVPEKVGMAAVQRDGFEYEFTVVFELDMNHKAFATKDRTRLFEGKEGEKITEATGSALLAWSQTGAEPAPAAPAAKEDTRPEWDAQPKKPAFTPATLVGVAANANLYATADELMAAAAAKYELTQDDMAAIKSAFDAAKKKAAVSAMPAPKEEPKKEAVTLKGQIFLAWLSADLPKDIIESRKAPGRYETMVGAVLGNVANPNALTDKQEAEVLAHVKAINTQFQPKK